MDSTPLDTDKLLMGVLHKMFLCGICFNVPSEALLFCSKNSCITISDKPADSHSDDDDIPYTKLYSWKPKPSCWVTLIKDGIAGTIMYVHSCGEPFYTKEHAHLDARCPSGTAFLAQVIMDEIEVEDGKKLLSPRIMILDILQHDGKHMFHDLGLLPVERYRFLIENCGAYFPSSYMQIQWAGEKKSALQFCLPSDTSPSVPNRNLPHVVDYVFSYASDRILHMELVERNLAH